MENNVIINDRRKTPRFSCEDRARYAMDIDNIKDAGRLVDLSRHGISFESANEVRRDQIYRLHIYTDDPQQFILCQASIRWVQPNPTTNTYLCGGRIIEMDPSAKMEILDKLYQQWKYKAITTKAQ